MYGGRVYGFMDLWISVVSGLLETGSEFRSERTAEDLKF